MNRLVSRWRRHGQMLTGIADQGIIGFGNLAIGLFVLRTSSKEEYGLYGLFYMTLILLNGFANALFVVQLTTSYHRRTDREAMAAALLCGQLVLSGSLGLLVALVGWLLSGSVFPPEVRTLLVVSALAGPAAMAHEFMRGYFFLLGAASMALALDALLILGWLLATSVLGMGAGVPMGTAALSGFGIAAALAGCVGLGLSGLTLRQARPRVARAVAEAWKHGRWALGGAVVTALQNQAYIYVLAGLASARAIAELNAARMLMVPVGLLIAGIGRTLVPTLARLAAERRVEDMRRTAARTLATTVAAVALYSTGVFIARPFLIGGVLGSTYDDIDTLVLFWMVVFFLQAIDANLSVILQATQRFRDLMLVNLWTVVPVLTMAVPLIRLYGPEGSLLALGGGYAGMALLLWPRVRSSLDALAPMEERAQAAAPPAHGDVEPLLGIGGR